MARWQKRIMFGWFRNEQDFLEVFNLAAMNGEIIHFAYLDNHALGSAIVLFEKHNHLYTVNATVCLQMSLAQQWRPQPTTWEEVAQQAWLGQIKSYGARQKLLRLFREHGVSNDSLVLACHTMFPNELRTLSAAS